MTNVVNGLSHFINSPAVIKHIDKTISNDVFAAKMLLAANVARDVFETISNVDQSINNKQVPPKERKFIAMYEAASGALTCLVQLTAGLAIANKKVQSILYNKLFGEFKRTSPALFNNGKMGFAIATSLIVSSIIAKRIIVPILASPLASLFENKANDKKTGKNEVKIPVYFKANIKANSIPVHTADG